MQVSVEATSTLERKLTVGVPAERVDAEVDARLQKAAKTVAIKGFRAGKVPMKVVRQRFGHSVRQEVLGDVFNQTFFEAVQQKQLKPVGLPSIETKSIEPGKDIEYVATFEVFPEVTLKDYSDISLVKFTTEITEQDIDQVIESLRMQAAGWEQVERAAQDGDLVNLDFVGTKDGEHFQGGTHFGSDLFLGSKRMIPGFEEGVVGMKPGEEKVLELSCPADYQSPELAGAQVKFEIKLHTVKERTPAPLDEKFFKRFGVTEGGEEGFRQEVLENMKRELKTAARNRIKTQIMEALLKAHPELEVPKALVKNEIGALREQAMQQFAGRFNQQMDPVQMLPDALFEKQAARRVKLGTIINEFVTKHALSADPERVKQEVDELASTYEDREQVISWYYSSKENLQGVEALVLEDQVVDMLVDGAKVTEEVSSYTEMMKPPAAAEETA